MRHANFILIIVTFIMMSGYAQPGSIDPTFNPVDSGFWRGSSFNASVTASVVQNDGKFIIAGEFTKYNETKAFHIVRFNPNGIIDSTLKNTGTGATLIKKIILQQDKKILIVGGFRNYNNIGRNGIARLNADGSLDNTFDPGLGMDPVVAAPHAMVLQNDGKIIIGGYVRRYNGKDVNNIVRINSDGSQDTTFHVGAGFDSKVYSIVLQNDGKIIIAGSFTKYNNISCNYIVRLNPDGSRDNMFSTSSGPDAYIKSILLQDDGKLMIIGTFKNYDGLPRNRIARLNPDGSLDYSFYDIGGLFTGDLVEVVRQTDEKIIVSEALNTIEGRRGKLVRLNKDGSVDNSFSLGKTNDYITSLFLQNDGEIIIGGNFTKWNETIRNHIARLNVDGTLDKDVFNVWGKGLNGTLWTSAIQKDGKIVIGGLFTHYNGTACENIARINVDGSLDTTFHTATGTNDWVESIAIQNDGKILVGGWFTTCKGLTSGGIARLNPDGSLDTTLKANPGFDAFVEHVTLQADGKIIVSGNFMTHNGVTANGILRLYGNGAVDTTFKTGTGSDLLIWATLIQPDGKIVIAGFFNSYNGINVTNIARLNSNGSIDTSFHTGGGTSDMIYALGLQKDGKILIAGVFNKFNGLQANQITRLNTNGSLDNTFNSGTGTGNLIGTLAIQENGKIIVGGTYTSYNGTAANSLVRLNSDGSLDNTFLSGSGVDNGVWTIVIQSNGKIIIGGRFISYNGTGRNNVARVIGDEVISVDENIDDNSIIIYPNPNNGEFTIIVEQIGEISIMDNLGRLVLEKKLNSKKDVINLTKLNSGVYFIRINTEDQQIIKKIVISK